MHLSAAVVACNENDDYLAYWPLVKRAWALDPVTSSWTDVGVRDATATRPRR